MAVPAWIAATTGQSPLAAQINQLLGTHAATYLYTGTQQGGHTTLGSGAVDSNGLYMAQSFTAGSSFTLGRIVVTLALTGAPGATTVSIQTSSGGAPSGTVLASTTLPPGAVPASAGAVSIPLPCALTSGTGYWIVVAAAGDASDFYAWSESDQVSGASTSTNGTSWTAQSYGLCYAYYDQSAIAPLVHTYDDAGARWTTWTWSGAQPASVQEWTQGQTAAGYLYSSDTLGYSGSVLSSVTQQSGGMKIPTYLAPHNGIVGDASATAGTGQVNQFLGTHPYIPVYQGAPILAPNGTGGTPWGQQLSTLDVDQPFTMSGTSIGRVVVPLLPVGTGADLLVSLWTDSAGTPGTMVNQTRIPASWIYQLAAVSGAPAPSGSAPSMAYTGNPLALAQFNNLHSGSFTTGTWPLPAVIAAGGVTTPASASYGNYIVLVGGTNPGATATFNNVYSVQCGGGTIAPAVPQSAYPTTIFSPTVIVVPETDGVTLTAVSTGGFLSASSGTNNANVFTAGFNAATGNLAAWSAQTSLPLALNGHSAATANGYVYVLGGQDGSSTYRSGVYYAQVQNGQLGAWTQTTSLPIPLGDMYTAALDGFVFALGGGNTSLTNYQGWYAAINADGSLRNWIPTTASPYFIAAALQPAPTAGGFGIVLPRETFVTALAVSANGPDVTWTNNEVSPSVPTTLTSALVQAGDGQWQLYQLDSTFYASAVTLSPSISAPLPTTGLTNGATYHLTLQQQGGDLNNYLLTHLDEDVFPGNPTLNTSPAGAYAWTAGSAGAAVPLQVFDLSAPGAAMTPLHTWGDNGARISTYVQATTPDQSLLGYCEATRRSVALNANTGFETGIAPWTVTGGTPAQSAAEVYEGRYALQITPSGSAANVIAASEIMPCMPGQWCTATGRVWFTSAVTSNFSMSIAWYTAATGGTQISTSSSLVSVPAATWTPESQTIQAPTGAYGFQIQATLSGTPSTSQRWYLDAPRAYPTYAGPQNSTVAQVATSGLWPAPTVGTGVVQLA